MHSKKYHFLGTVPQWNRNIVVRQISLYLTHIHECLLSWLVNKKEGGVNLVLWIQSS
jgi:hypothetical protein